MGGRTRPIPEIDDSDADASQAHARNQADGAGANSISARREDKNDQQ
jgi:hypothetical protein